MATTKPRSAPSRIAPHGMGGFLNPPGHPEHSFSVEYDLQRRHNRSACSLSSAAREQGDWIKPAVRTEARRMLKAWADANASATPDSTWVAQVLGYFKGCYRGPIDLEGREWHAGNLVIDSERDPLASADTHAGVHFIRGFYPDFQPTADMFRTAQWGSAQ